MKTGLQIFLGFYALAYLFTAGILFALGDQVNGDPTINWAADAQIRALSAPFAMFGLLLWWIIPNIEKHVGLLRLVCLAIMLGASGRLVSYVVSGQTDGAQLSSMIFEFAFPLALVWQQYVIRHALTDSVSSGSAA